GGAQPPAGLAPAARQQVQDAIRSALINTFQTALWICAGLAWASAAMAAVFIRDPARDRAGEMATP
ncbi:MAG: hypothetical protein GYA17_14830, partial [Chloroflexi bacterium]|nr:hypothetical protein [Chloroflexota bacterium]